MRTLPGGRGDTERMTKQPVPQPLRLAGLCLPVAAIGVFQRSSSLALAVPGITVVMASLTGLCFSPHRRSRSTGDGIVRSLCRTALA